VDWRALVLGSATRICDSFLLMIPRTTGEGRIARGCVIISGARKSLVAPDPMIDRLICSLSHQEHIWICMSAPSCESPSNRLAMNPCVSTLASRGLASAYTHGCDPFEHLVLDPTRSRSPVKARVRAAYADAAVILEPPLSSRGLGRGCP
jgi:hypothetical protein